MGDKLKKRPKRWGGVEEKEKREERGEDDTVL